MSQFDVDDEMVEGVDLDLPLESHITKPCADMETVIEDVVIQIRNHFAKRHLSEITLSFVYENGPGYTEVSTYYEKA